MKRKRKTVVPEEMDEIRLKIKCEEELTKLLEGIDFDEDGRIVDIEIFPEQPFSDN